MDHRRDELTLWVQGCLGRKVAKEKLPQTLDVVSGDASFRRYFRARFEIAEGLFTSLIAVDAPPEKENNPAFVEIAKVMDAFGVNVPEVFEVDYDRGFMLLSDLGDQLMLPLLKADTVDKYYQLAMDTLLAVQRSSFEESLPEYDEALLQSEMALFSDWLLLRHLGLVLTDADREMLKKAFVFLADQALSQPQVTVHRDFHSRNLMCLPGDEIGVIDFQDAVHGPITYDIVSLLKDCYCQWPQQQVEKWALTFLSLLRNSPEHDQALKSVDDKQYLQWFSTMAAQRHLKAAGIFARLCHRDGKAGYLADIPRTVSYLVEETRLSPELFDLHTMLVEIIVPAIKHKHPESEAFA
ncbi:hypothetical protein A9Q99_12530 [Gammaproteobacteria bacterium 45_16_T64]|nr:hypothetical protein A9Q99_12530 [Gammaproteobacteria bacterium 45_16_T64]